MAFLARHAISDARNGTTPTLRNIRAAFSTLDKAGARYLITARPRDSVLDGRIDLLEHRTFMRPSSGHGLSFPA